MTVKAKIRLSSGLGMDNAEIKVKQIRIHKREATYKTEHVPAEVLEPAINIPAEVDQDGNIIKDAVKKDAVIKPATSKEVLVKDAHWVLEYRVFIRNFDTKAATQLRGLDNCIEYDLKGNPVQEAYNHLKKNNTLSDTEDV